MLRAIDRGSAVENRALLRGAASAGAAPFELLRAGRYDEVVQLLGRDNGRLRLKPPELSREVRAERQPLPVAVVLSTVPEKPRPTSGRLRGSFPIQKKKRDE